MIRYSRGVLGLLLAAAAPAALLAQREGPPTEGSIRIGASRYDLSSTGTGASLNAGLTLPLAGRTVFLEPSIGILRITTAFGHHSSWLFPELTAQVQQGLGAVRPYLGGGIGTGTTGLSGVAHWKFTLLALAGARVHLAGRWGVRGEVRLRSVDPWVGHTADFGVGFTHGGR
ncbi:MAG TPA: hypothetical protein VFU23_00650 [Gemmatimonadales bacterium]|nr:hypothetical protein [Gemmatimonadales bacterium]